MGLQHFLLFLISLISTIGCSAQSAVQSTSLIEKFQALNEHAQVITYKSTLEVNNDGGHLQGVQLVESRGDQIVYISGSSDREAYLLEVSLVEKELKQIYELMVKPYKHAGGIQVWQDQLVVGIEDNIRKDKSRVCIYELDDLSKSHPVPWMQIYRNGNPLRATAGCVGMSIFNGDRMLVVGDWDTRHLDIYCIDGKQVPEKPDYELSMADQDRSAWVDKHWYAYQNINLLQENGQLYLVGMGQDGKGNNIADLYLFEPDKGNKALKKIVSKRFECTHDVNFRAGAGMMQKDNGELVLVSCGGHARALSYLNVFR